MKQLKYLLQDKEKLLATLEDKAHTILQEIGELKLEKANLESELRLRRIEFETQMKVEKAAMNEERIAYSEDTRKKVENVTATLTKEKEEAISKLQNEIKELKAKSELDLLTLKLEFDKKLAQLEVEKEKAILAEVKKLREESIEQINKATKENYESFKTEIAKLHSEGNIQTRFIKEMSEKMLAHKLEERKLVVNKSESTNGR